jgi:DNA-binding Lrp family transcriptional regulator
MNAFATHVRLDDLDRRLIKATQSGLPICRRPYDKVAETLQLPVDDVLFRLGRLLEAGVIRRIGVVPNHYRLGYTANGMSVWDVDDDAVAEVGPLIGDLDFVSHCYHRPRRLPLWPYNLFAMVHGHDRDEVAAKVEVIAKLLEPHSRRHEILYSTRILKKTGLRLMD